MAELDKDDERPALSPEGLLRALMVQVPGSGVSWEPTVQLCVISDDVSGAQPFSPLPEAAFGDALQPGIAGEFACLQLLAGRRGCWSVMPKASAAIKWTRYDSEEVAPPLLLPVVVPYQWSVNGGVETVCSLGTLLASPGPDLLASNITGISPGRLIFWVPPGGILRFTSQVAGGGNTFDTMLREPLGPP